jgi:hypothetical protein
MKIYVTALDSDAAGDYAPSSCIAVLHVVAAVLLCAWA